MADALDQYAATATYASEPPLFASKEEYEAFHARHMSHSVPRVPFSAQCGPVHIGIDSGSTTVKLVVVDEKSQILTPTINRTSATRCPSSGNSC
mgnify:FL=1